MCACVIQCMCVHIWRACVCALGVCVCSVCSCMCMYAACMCIYVCSCVLCACTCVCMRAWVHTPWHMYKVQRTAVRSWFPFHLGLGCQACPAGAFSHWLISLVFFFFFAKGASWTCIQTLHSWQPYSLSLPGMQIFFSWLWSFFTNYNTWTFAL